MAPTQRLRLLLDEHYSPLLRDLLRARGVDAVALTHDRPELRGRPDDEVLALARNESRVVVTEDVTTFAAAIAAVPDHVGVIFCNHARFPRTRAGIHALAEALASLSEGPPEGLGSAPIALWLSRQPTSSGDAVARSSRHRDG
ncbi:MAG: DUF5615 family PIN-like protein [Bifidobacteriaceae bacterium]|jgi:predicted nuclease of predicted toxin-antitoxin system|nr:DUF5615 family PIN-like protein [Bifidobacteriaceae bacterium]